MRAPRASSRHEGVTRFYHSTPVSPGLSNTQSFQFQKNFLWHASCSRDNRHARKTKVKVETCPRRQLPSERRLPLRQPPAEQPFSASPRNWNPVSNDWVLPHLESNIFLQAQYRFSSHSCTSQFIQVLRLAYSDSVSSCDEICHFDGDVFCLFDLFMPVLSRLLTPTKSLSEKYFSAHLRRIQISS